ncbi:Gfo/Idh/MocA family protein [Paenibacillus silviterrae]|uniref:Gfo/Idh/MocA family protein n=1 Tax=Paenibacillus silviterrae TaxID=3242194 RepID=UPI0025437D9C|nr:Gfo/Idh/MocA family oxidoreductase [Paenibacillus chinjuensis]
MRKIKFAIVGCGHIAKKHIESIEKSSITELVAVCDTNVDRLNEFKEIYNVEGYLDLEEMLQKQVDIDVVNICTPSGLHKKLAVMVASYKKHVVVEKPIALTLEDANAIIEACEANKVKLSVVHPNRFRPAVQLLKEEMEKESLGKISHVNATVRWNRNQAYYDQAAWRGTKEFDGGVLMNQAIHNLDLLIWLFGEIDEVKSFTATRLRKIEAEDVAVSILKFKKGFLGIIEAAATIYPKNLEESISVFGEQGTVIIGGTTANWVKHIQIEGYSEESLKEKVLEIDNNPYGESGHYLIIEDMAQCVLQKDRIPLVSGEDGKEALKLVLAIYKSAESSNLIPS